MQSGSCSSLIRTTSRWDEAASVRPVDESPHFGGEPGGVCEEAGGGVPGGGYTDLARGIYEEVLQGESGREGWVEGETRDFVSFADVLFFLMLMDPSAGIEQSEGMKRFLW